MSVAIPHYVADAAREVLPCQSSCAKNGPRTVGAAGVKDPHGGGGRGVSTTDTPACLSAWSRPQAPGTAQVPGQRVEGKATGLAGGCPGGQPGTGGCPGGQGCGELPGSLGCPLGSQQPLAQCRALPPSPETHRSLCPLDKGTGGLPWSTLLLLRVAASLGDPELSGVPRLGVSVGPGALVPWLCCVCLSVYARFLTPQGVALSLGSEAVSVVWSTDLVALVVTVLG